MEAIAHGHGSEEPWIACNCGSMQLQIRPEQFPVRVHAHYPTWNTTPVKGIWKDDARLAGLQRKGSGHSRVGR